jgi:sugar lactone lactonase YvrE
VPRSIVNLLTALTPLWLGLAACGDDDAPDDRSVADAGPGESDGGDGADGGPDASAPDAGPALDCEAVPAAPVPFESLMGFTASEDFQFDDQGRFVGGDDDGNLVRITKDGERRLFVPNAGAGSAGMRFLSNGDLIFARVDDGTLYRAAPNGGFVPILSGLSYPNGVEVDLDDQVYVSEQAVGRVRKVDPVTGAFTIVARGLSNPNGLSFAPDYRTLYCGSFGAGVVYAIPFDEEGFPTTPSIFAETPDAPGAPAPEGPTAESTAACVQKRDGDACRLLTEDGERDGACYTLGRALYCDATTASGDPMVDACVELAVDDACVVDWGDGMPESDGVCQDYEGTVYCSTDPGTVACTGREAGSACTVEGSAAGEGECVDYGSGTLYCQLPSPASVACAGLEAGSACSIVWGPGDPVGGECASDGFGGLQCSPPVPWLVACEGLAAGDACSYVTADPGAAALGECESYGGDLLSCGVDPYADPFATACEDGAPGDPCQAWYLGETFEGDCVDYEDGLYCQAQPDIVTPCVGLAAGDVCTVDYWGYPYDGECAADDAGALSCDLGNLLGGSGGLDGLEVDGCGSVYVTEFALGKVWRIAPDGSTVELLFDPPVAWIPNLHWGNGLGGFAADKLYVANRDEAGLFEVSVGVPGKPRSYP